MHPPAKYLILIESSGASVARMFDAARRPLAEFDASSSEVAVMTQGLMPERGAGAAEWDAALAGHSARERAQAELYALDL